MAKVNEFVCWHIWLHMHTYTPHGLFKSKFNVDANEAFATNNLSVTINILLTKLNLLARTLGCYAYVFLRFYKHVYVLIR